MSDRGLAMNVLVRPSAPGGGLAAHLALLKPRVMSLVVFTGLVGLVLAPGVMDPGMALLALVCIAIGAGASGAINMWYDADIDARMLRTCDRPIPRGRVRPGSALAMGCVLAVASVLAMAWLVNLPAAGLLAGTIAFYVFVYTIWLKRRTPQNIVIGGAAGAFPPMIGWAAATGEVDPASLALFAIIFIWTPPHFWSLALYRAEDYRHVGVPMLPVVAGKAVTRRQILIYSLLLVPVSLLPVALGVCAAIYAAGAALLGLGFLVCAVRVWRAADGDEGPARQMFGFSILYLFALFALMLGERLIAVWS